MGVGGKRGECGLALRNLVDGINGGLSDQKGGALPPFTFRYL
jgi:hypothetical protein